MPDISIICLYVLTRDRYRKMHLSIDRYHAVDCGPVRSKSPRAKDGASFPMIGLVVCRGFTEDKYFPSAISFS